MAGYEGISIKYHQLCLETMPQVPDTGEVVVCQT